MKIGFLSLGCPKNLVDGEVMLGIAREAGHEITPDAVGRRRARREHLRLHRLAPSRSRSTRSSRWPQQKRDGTLLAAGRHRLPRRALSRRAAEGDPGDRRGARHGRGAGDPRRRSVRRRGSGLADSRIGRGLADQLVSARDLRSDRRSRAHRAPESPIAAAPDRRRSPTYIYDADTPRLLTTPRHFAYVKIAEGCDYTCAFCIIPTLRGAVPQPDGRLDRARGAGAGRARRARAAADLAGHDVLRHRPRRARRARRGCCAS